MQINNTLSPAQIAGIGKAMTNAAAIAGIEELIDRQFEGPESELSEQKAAARREITSWIAPQLANRL